MTQPVGKWKKKKMAKKTQKNMKQWYPTIIMSWAYNSVTNWWNLPMSNPKPDLHNINAHIKFGENPFTCCCPETKVQDVLHADNSVKNCQNLPISNPKAHFHNVNAHTKFSWKSIDIYCSYDPKTKRRTCHRHVTVKNWWNLPISNPKPNLHNINAHTKFGK